MKFQSDFPEIIFRSVGFQGKADAVSVSYGSINFDVELAWSFQVYLHIIDNSTKLRELGCVHLAVSGCGGDFTQPRARLHSSFPYCSGACLSEVWTCVRCGDRADLPFNSNVVVAAAVFNAEECGPGCFCVRFPSSSSSSISYGCSPSVKVP